MPGSTSSVADSVILIVRMEEDDERPTLVMLGEGEPMQAALEEALQRHATFADTASSESPVATVLASAPDLVVLVGDAVSESGQILAELSQHPVTSVIPIVLLDPEPDLARRLDAARRGVAVVERTASADAMAREIAQLARELPDRPKDFTGSLEATSLNEVVQIIQRELSSGILSVSQEDGDASARFVLRSGRHVDRAIQDFVRKLKPLLEAEKPLRYEFQEAPTGGLQVVDEAVGAGDRNIFRRRRLLLVEDDAAAADILAQELRAQGSSVAVATSAGAGLHRARTLDPEIVLVDEAALDGEGYAILQQIRRDLLLRWASMIVLRRSEVLDDGPGINLSRLAGSMEPLIATDREITEKARVMPQFGTRLEVIGPSRLLRALVASGQTVHATIRHPRAMVEIDIAQGLIAGAEAVRMGDASKRLGGPVALTTLLALGSGRVTIERREHPAVANMLMPVVDAFAAALRETPPIKPSLPPAPKTSEPAGPPAGLYSELEGLIRKLGEVGMLSPRIVDEAAKQIASEAPRAAAAPKPEEPAPKPREMVQLPPKDPTLPGVLVPEARAAADGARRPRRRRDRTLVGLPMPPVRKPGADVSLPTPAEVQSKGKSTAAPGAKKKSGTLPPPMVSAKLGKPPVPPPKTPAALFEPTRHPPSSQQTLDVKDDLETTLPEDWQEIDATAADVALPDAAGEPVPEMELDTSGEKPTDPAPRSLPEPTFDAAAVPSGAATSSASMDPPAVGVPLASDPAPSLSPSTASAFGGQPAHASHSDEVPLAPVATGPRRGMVAAMAVAALVGVIALAAVMFWPKDADPVLAATNAPQQTPRAEPPAPATAVPAQVNPSNPNAVAPVVEAENDDGAETDQPDLEGATAGLEGTATADPEAEDPESADPEAAGSESADSESENPELDSADANEAESNIPESGDETQDSEPEMDPATRRARVAALINQANFLRGRGNKRMARRRYLDVLRLQSRNGRAFAGLARLAISEGNGAEAVRYARQLARVNPAVAGTHVLLGDAYRLAGDTAAATRSYERALRVSPRNRAARARLGR